jgi:hypothetical protein
MGLPAPIEYSQIQKLSLLICRLCCVPSDLGTYGLACQDGSRWLVFSSLVVQRCRDKIGPR